MKHAISVVLALAVLVTLPVLAQQQTTQGPNAILEYFQDSSGDMMIRKADGSEITGAGLDIGMELPIGSTLVTFDGDSAEIRLRPNGSIIKVAANTNFQIEGLQGVGNADASRFAVAVGKIRNVAGRTTGNERYIVKGRSTVAGVRGTDWAMQVVPDRLERAFTFKGLIEFTNAAGETIEVGAGKFADAFASAFEATDLTQAMIDEVLQDLGFVRLSPEEVPGQAAETPPPAETTEAVTPTEEEPAVSAEPPAAPKPPAPESAILKWLRSVLGMEIGSLTIGDEVFSKAVLQPTFALGKLKLSLYLPIIYRSNMFDPEDWYHPEGNNEWSFGADQGGDAISIVQDVAKDLFLKIRYIQFGEQRDPFFFKVGNLNNITIGSGFLMREFANDADFPSVRRVGLNIGVDAKSVGFELMANDLSSLPPEIFGGRFYVKPFGKLAIGVGAVVDINPSGNMLTPAFFHAGFNLDLPIIRSDFLSSLPPEIFGGRFYVKPFGKLAIGVGAVVDINPSGNMLTPAFFHAGFNLDLPIIRSDFLSLILFADIASSVPYFKEDYTDPVSGESVTAGLHTEAVIDPDAPVGIAKVKNWGFAAGLQGNILIARYRVEYRYLTGNFTAAYFDSGYERERPRRVNEVVTYLNHMDDPAYHNLVMGIYGEAGFSFLKDRLTFTAGYMWPWVPGVDLSTLPPEEWPDDYLRLKFAVARGVIPVLGISGSLSYERSRFASAIAAAPDLATALASLFDANTVAKAEIIYPVAPIMDMALLVTTTLKRDAEGNVVPSLDEDGNRAVLPELDTSVTIEMRVHL